MVSVGRDGRRPPGWHLSALRGGWCRDGGEGAAMSFFGPAAVCGDGRDRQRGRSPLPSGSTPRAPQTGSCTSAEAPCHCSPSTVLRPSPGDGTSELITSRGRAIIPFGIVSVKQHGFKAILPLNQSAVKLNSPDVKAASGWVILSNANSTLAGMSRGNPLWLLPFPYPPEVSCTFRLSLPLLLTIASPFCNPSSRCLY